MLHMAQRLRPGSGRGGVGGRRSLTRWERVYSGGMAKFTREEILAKVAARESLEGADLSGVELEWPTDLSGANLEEANLAGAHLSKAFLTGANLHSANLVAASLVGANLSGAELTYVDLSRVNLTGADLSEADLSEAFSWTKADLRGAKYTSKTMWPDYFDPEAAGVVLVD